MVPLAPVTFLITTGWFHRLVSSSPTSRAITSSPVLGENGTMKVIGLSERPSADALRVKAPPAATKHAAVAPSTSVLMA